MYCMHVQYYVSAIDKEKRKWLIKKVMPRS